MPEFEQHTYVFTSAPTEAPPTLGAHGFDALAKEVYISVGIDDVSDWVKMSSNVNTNDVIYVSIQELTGTRYVDESDPFDDSPWRGKTVVITDDGSYLGVYEEEYGELDGWPLEFYINLADKPTEPEDIENIVGTEYQLINMSPSVIYFYGDDNVNFINSESSWTGIYLDTLNGVEFGDWLDGYLRQSDATFPNQWTKFKCYDYDSNNDVYSTVMYLDQGEMKITYGDEDDDD